MLQPVLVLIAWSIVMLVWLYVRRLPMLFSIALSRPTLADGEATRLLKPTVQWPADNYNNLMEQPTLFYAIAAVLAIEGQGGGYNLMLAWAYVGLRILHSIIQATFNRIIVRFWVFGLSTIALAALTVHAGFAVWHVHLH